MASRRVRAEGDGAVQWRRVPRGAVHSSAWQGNGASSHGGQSALQAGGDVAVGAVRPSVAKALKSDDGFKCRSDRLVAAVIFSEEMNCALIFVNLKVVE